jgi:hypothetical protein
LYRYLLPVPYILAGVRHRGLLPAKRPVVLFVPEKPQSRATIYKMCKVQGYRIATRPTAKADIVVRWEDTTIGRPVELRPEWAANARLVNFGCLDISKRRLDEAHREVFGYGLSVDPLTYVGRGVIKSNTNARHDGRIVSFPIEHVEEGVVYQRLIRNEIEGGGVQDMRITVVGTILPFLYVRSRAETDQFGRDETTVNVLSSTDEHLAPHEQQLILALARRLGIDYGEFDVLRDVDDGRIYVVDANNTPVSPTTYVWESHHWKNLSVMSEAFRNEFAMQRT